MPDCKQPYIIEELRRRIVSGELTGKFPPVEDLSNEFGVNFKTMNKALNHLVDEELLTRKRGSGTFVRSLAKESENRVIEVLFEGYETILHHPYWGEVWHGVMKTLTTRGYQALLNNLDADPKDGILLLDRCRFAESAGKVLIGVSETRLIHLLRDTVETPFVAVGDEVEDPEVLSVYVDDRRAILDMVDYLWEKGCRKIAFIGVACSYTNQKLANRFRFYLDAVQRHRQIAPDMIADVRLLARNGYPAMLRILEKGRPDAVIVSGNHLIPGVARALTEAGLSIPGDVEIVGCDGVDPGGDFPVRTAKVDRLKCGELAVELLLTHLHRPLARNRRRVRVESVF